MQIFSTLKRHSFCTFLYDMYVSNILNVLNIAINVVLCLHGTLTYLILQICVHCTWRTLTTSKDTFLVRRVHFVCFWVRVVCSQNNEIQILIPLEAVCCTRIKNRTSWHLSKLQHLFNNLF